MKKNLLPRTVLVLGVIGVCLFFLMPTILGQEEIQIGPSKLNSVNLGLDLRGGMQVVLRVLVEKAITDDLAVDIARLKEVMKEKKIEMTDAKIAPPKSVDITFASLQAKEQGIAYLKENWTRYALQEKSETNVTVSLDDRETKYLKDNALTQAKETIVNRIDQFSVKEPEIYTQGKDQIVVRLPGIVDPTRAKALIGKTAVLEFKIVGDRSADYATTREILLERHSGNVPEGYSVYPAAAEGRAHGGFYLLRKTADMAGKDLVDARRTQDNKGGAAVSFQFNSEAGRNFGRLTERNLQKQLAIVLDDKVMSAPVIQSRITDHGQITGEFTVEEARDLAIVLRSGSLPVPVEIEEERTVGPTLGQDSIHKGMISLLVGSILVVGFMIFYYKRAGVIADFALIGNVIMILGVMSLFGATLTLPGIAGIVLTIGMAVDANVIINERVREELRSGKTARAAVDAGYEKALWAILDSNLTTAIAGLVLYQFGTGPIKGFAVTLLIGLASSVFTAVTGTRLIYDYIFQNRREIKTISI